MKIRGIGFLTSVLALCGIMLSGQAYSADPICEGLTGAAFGQCQAAVAVGCDGTEAQPPGCEKINENFKKIVGEEPPWILGKCPCGTVEDYIVRIKERIIETAAEIRLYDEGYKVLHLGDVFEATNPPRLLHYEAYAFTFYPGSSILTNGKQTCGFYNTSMYQLEDYEAKSCVATMLQAVTDTGIRLIEP